MTLCPTCREKPVEHCKCPVSLSSPKRDGAEVVHGFDGTGRPIHMATGSLPAFSDTLPVSIPPILDLPGDTSECNWDITGTRIIGTLDSLGDHPGRVTVDYKVITKSGLPKFDSETVVRKLLIDLHVLCCGDRASNLLTDVAADIVRNYFGQLEANVAEWKAECERLRQVVNELDGFNAPLGKARPFVIWKK